jgi:hypothetical protein
MRVLERWADDGARQSSIFHLKMNALPHHELLSPLNVCPALDSPLSISCSIYSPVLMGNATQIQPRIIPAPESSIQALSLFDKRYQLSVCAVNPSQPGGDYSVLMQSLSIQEDTWHEQVKVLIGEGRQPASIAELHACIQLHYWTRCAVGAPR